ncbi:MAG TPA: PPC domain-containing DNA-binding protein [Stellaceae bacterium]|nr:PPC domain-containing DNA-binding protein [Stellaceae bacterium]
MHWKLLDLGPPATHAVVLARGDEAVAALGRFVDEERVNAASLSAIGAFERAVVGYFDWQRKQYKRIPVNEQVEVLSLIGDVAAGPDGKPALHIHAVLGRADGSVVGGHLLEGHVRPTLEVILVEPPAHLRKRKDPESGLALIALEASS